MFAIICTVSIIARNVGKESFFLHKTETLLKRSGNPYEMMVKVATFFI